MEGVLFIIVAIFIIFVGTFFKVKTQKINDLQETVDADTRSKNNHKIRRAKTVSNNIVVILVGIILGIIFLSIVSK